MFYYRCAVALSITHCATLQPPYHVCKLADCVHLQGKSRVRIQSVVHPQFFRFIHIYIYLNKISVLSFTFLGVNNISVIFYVITFSRSLVSLKSWTAVHWTSFHVNSYYWFSVSVSQLLFRLRPVNSLFWACSWKTPNSSRSRVAAASAARAGG